MKYRRSTFCAAAEIIALCICIVGSTKGAQAFDPSKSTSRSKEANFKSSYAERPLVVPPQPRDRNGNLRCTKNRYIQGERQFGIASWYGPGFEGNKTANGERFNQNAYTLAHLTLPMGTRVSVENPATGTTLIARVNDCGPFIDGRIVDLSKGLAEKLGIKLGPVIITVL